MLTYVYSEFHPSQNNDKGWELKFRLQSLAKAALLVAAGIYDVALGILFYVPAKISELAHWEWKRVQSFKKEGYYALDDTLPKAHRSFLRAINPDALFVRTNHVDFTDLLFEDGVTETLLRKIETWSKSNSFLVSQVGARILALYTVPVAMAACAADLATQPLFFTASLLALGENEYMNTFARNHLRLYTHIEGVVKPILHVFYPQIQFHSLG